MKKINFKNYFFNNLFFILIASLIFTVSSYIVFDTLSKPRIQNKVEILIGAEINNKKEMENEFLSYCNDDIYKINITALEADSDLFLNYYTASISNVDLLILPSFFLEKNGFKQNLNQYLNLDEELLEEKTQINDFSFYEVENLNKGILIYKQDDKKGYLDEDINYNNKFSYYLFLNKKSYHIGELNNKKSNACFDIIKEVFKNE